MLSLFTSGQLLNIFLCMDPEDFSKGSLRGEGVPRIIVFAGGSASYFLVNLLYYLIFEFFRAWGRGGGPFNVHKSR